MMPLYAYALLAAGWLAWMARFLIVRRNRGHVQKVDRRARWGILLEVIAYALLWQNHFWERPLPLWRSGLSVLFFALAALLSWTAVPALGRQWRIEASLSCDHQLVTTGPYGVVRHPIYTGLLAASVGTALTMGRVAAYLGVTSCLVAILMRVHDEDALMAEQFPASHSAYRKRTKAPNPVRVVDAGRVGVLNRPRTVWPAPP
jgi:protein-S-isoprenylcysteine O-methyltransferase Ste14